MRPTPARLVRVAAARRSGPACSGGSTASILPTRAEPRVRSLNGARVVFATTRGADFVSGGGPRGGGGTARRCGGGEPPADGSPPAGGAAWGGGRATGRR